MLNSLLNEASELASSLALLGFEVATKELQSLASFTGVNPGIIVACAAGLLVFVLALKVVSAVK